MCEYWQCERFRTQLLSTPSRAFNLTTNVSLIGCEMPAQEGATESTNENR